MGVGTGVTGVERAGVLESDALVEAFAVEVVEAGAEAGTNVLAEVAGINVLAGAAAGVDALAGAAAGAGTVAGVDALVEVGTDALAGAVAGTVAGTDALAEVETDALAGVAVREDGGADGSSSSLSRRCTRAFATALVVADVDAEALAGAGAAAKEGVALFG